MKELPMIKKKSPRSKKILSSKTSAHLPTALVAGAAGFVGSHLCDTLILQNCKVIGLDNWSTGKKNNIKHLLNKKNFVFLEHDLNQPLKSPLPQVDYIFHLAGIEAYINGLDVSLETLLVNSLGTRLLLEIAKKNQAKFLLASTSDIFSGFISSKSLSQYFGTDHQQQEVYSHHEAKRFSEALTFEYLNRYHQDARIVRLGLTYGPRMDLSSGNDLARLFLAINKSKPLKLIGQGLKPLYPTYISDIIYGLTKAMFSQSSSGQIYTLVNPTSITSLNLAYKLKQLFSEKKLSIEFVSGEEPHGPANLSESTLNSQTNLGWTPKVDLEQGIQQTFKWLSSGKVLVPDVQLTDDQPLVDQPHDSQPNQPVSSASKSSLPPDEPVSLTDLGIKPIDPQPAKQKSTPQTPEKKKLLLSFPKPKLGQKLKALPNPKTIISHFRSWFAAIKLSPRLKFTFIILFLTLLLTLGPTLFIAASAYSGFRSLSRASQMTDLKQIDKIEKSTQKARRQFDASRGVLRRFQPAASLLGLKKLSLNLDRLLFIGSQLSRGIYHLAQAGQAGTLVSQIVIHHQDGNLNQALTQVKVNLDQAYNQLSFVESELQSGHQLTADLTTPMSQKIQLLTTALPQLRQKIDQARQALPILPSFFAQDSKKTYLLLFQNSAELRPTGGFIGSYGLLTFDQGKLLDFTVEDIYAADGQLKGYVEPPGPIKDYLGQSSWFFRDSNWDPDFSVAAQQAEWFLQKTTGRQVDGVIAVNLPAAKELLQATGPIILTDYNEEITADNLFERAEYHSEIDFFPGSTQKKDFLGSLSSELYNQAKNASASELLSLTQAIEASLIKKQLLFYLHDVNAQAILSKQNWAGAIFDPQTNLTLPGQTVVQDYSYLVEANLGINKANYFLKRQLKQELTILKTKDILVTTTVLYDNQSPADAWPGGVYRAYVRQFIPNTAKLISVKLGGSKLNLEKDIDLSHHSGKQVIGFPLTVLVKNTLELELAYRLADKLDSSQSGLSAGRQTRLAVVIPKQPGTSTDPVEVTINHPTFLEVIATNPHALASSQVLTFQSDLEQDRIFVVDFLEK